MTGLNKDKFFFFSDNFSNLEIYPNSLEHAYLAILQDELDAARLIFSSLNSPRANWGVALISILKGFIKKYPTYFQVRNFYEIDLDFLLKNNKIPYVEQMLGALDFLSTINQEVYKFAGRVMLENKLYSACLKYFEKSKIIFYNDPELHFLLAKYYLITHNKNEAEFYIDECLNLLPEYYPALQLKNRIEELYI